MLAHGRTDASVIMLIPKTPMCLRNHKLSGLVVGITDFERISQTNRRVDGMNEAAGAADAARGPTDGGGASRLEL